MAVIVGIDEAGFGPLLGPLVISSTAFALPDNLLNKDLWKILKKSTAQKRKHLAGRLLITDSKKAYSKALGIHHLRRTTLTCLALLDNHPTTLADLFQFLCPESLPRLTEYPWYQKADSHPLSPDKPNLDIAASLLKKDLAANQIKLLDLKSRCLDVAYYNQMVDAVKNKARVLFCETSALIARAFTQFGKDNLQIIIDKQGGRSHYRKNLLLMFPDASLQIICETPALSSYELTTRLRASTELSRMSSSKSAGQNKMRLHFAVKADSRFLPVALASILSKYLRELLIENINRYFLSFDTRLKPTAGYFKDGRRFIHEIKSISPPVPFNPTHLLRSR